MQQLTTIKPGTTLQRAFTVTRSAVNVEARTVELAFSSETPYDRYWGVEILDHSPQSIRLSRLSGGSGPVLWNHRSDKLVGVVEKVEIGQDRVGRAVVRLGKGVDATELFDNINEGICTNVSVGYQIHNAVMVETKGDPADSDSQPVYRVTDWEPYEISFVSIPADVSVGVGRSAESPVISIPLERTAMTTATATQATPPAAVTAAASAPLAPALTSQDVRNAETATMQRVKELIEVGDTFERFGGKQLARQAIERNESVETLRSHIMNAVTAQQTAPATDIGLTKKEARNFSMFRAVRALTEKSWKGAEFEQECHQTILKRTGLTESVHGGFYMPSEVQRRDLTVASATGGGNLVATDFQAASFIDLLRARIVLAQLGATFLTGLVGNVAIPKLTGAATAYWLTNEATAITESQQTVGQIALTPKNLGAYTELSRQLMLQSTPAAEAMVMDDLAKQLARAVDLAGIQGTGASGQPTGITATAGIGSVTGTTLDYADVVEFQTDVANSNALETNSAYLTTPTVAGLLMQRQRFSGTDTPLWEGSVQDGRVAGYRGTTTTAITAGSMLFGDFSQVAIGEWGMLEIALNPFANFTAAITGIRAIQSIDVAIRQAAAFSYATSIT